MMKTVRGFQPFLLLLLCVLLVVSMSARPVAAAQPAQAPIVFVSDPLIHAGVARGYVNTLAERLAAHGITAVEWRAAGEPVGQYAVLVELESLAEDCCASPFSFTLHIHPRPPRESLLSPALEAAHTGLTLEAGLTPARLDFTADLLAALSGYSQGACDLPLVETLRTAAPEHAPDGTALDYVYARCLYAAREYDAAVAVLEVGLEALPAEGLLPIIWQAAIAQNLAQSFQFDAALALDDALITALTEGDPPPGSEDTAALTEGDPPPGSEDTAALTEGDPPPGSEDTAALTEGDPPPGSEARALLAELYLLRGQHRLYLYEWDVVLADYAAALALEPDNARAYYLRGLLYMTQNAPEAALSDLRHFLALQAAQPVLNEHPDVIAQAEAYRAELETLLGTPPADPQAD